MYVHSKITFYGEEFIAELDALDFAVALIQSGQTTGAALFVTRETDSSQ